RQVLFDDRDAREGRPKVTATADAIARIGGPTRVECHPIQVDARTLSEVAPGVDLILDGTDNLATRYLLNDFALVHRIPWIYAGVVGGSGLVLPVLPHEGPCLRCIFPDPAPPGSLETCDSAGVILPAVSGVAALQASLALRLLAAPSPAEAELPIRLTQLDLWRGEFTTIRVARDPDCPACGRGEHPFLEQGEVNEPVVLCGRNAVQLPPSPARPDLERLAARLRSSDRQVETSPLMLRFRVDDLSLTVFPDGRAIVEGTEEPSRALAAYDRFLGS
ncbi:MAG: ThiF family adenylyltransferase, partial [Planctomycetota bacterium]